MLHLAQRRRRFRGVTVVVALLWLPYVAVRCIDCPPDHSGCPIHSAAAGPAESEPHAHHHGNEGSHHDAPPAGTCCDLTGKCNVLVTAGAAPDVPAIGVLLPAPLRPVVDTVRTHVVRLPPPLAHGPPIHLKHRVLII
jgi:hypothetical protein